MSNNIAEKSLVDIVWPAKGLAKEALALQIIKYSVSYRHSLMCNAAYENVMSANVINILILTVGT